MTLKNIALDASLRTGIAESEVTDRLGRYKRKPLEMDKTRLIESDGKIDLDLQLLPGDSADDIVNVVRQYVLAITRDDHSMVEVKAKLLGERSPDPEVKIHKLNTYVEALIETLTTLLPAGGKMMKIGKTPAQDPSSHGLTAEAMRFQGSRLQKDERQILHGVGILFSKKPAA